MGDFAKATKVEVASRASLQVEEDFGEEGPGEASEGCCDPKALEWCHGTGQGSWQGMAQNVRGRTTHLFNSRELSDISVLAVDENWWFGNTVKDFSAHKFMLGTASPVFSRILYELDEEEGPQDGECSRKLVLDERLQVTLTLSRTYYSEQFEWEGIAPVAAEALLEYIYKDKFNEADFENGYSRNLLWRLWHASKAFEMEHLHDLCAKTLDRTMCEDTVFWDLNYAMKYKAFVDSLVLEKALKIVKKMEGRVFEHPNFVWLDHETVWEILDKRLRGSSDPVTVLNNLLRWALYQVDRSACDEIDGKTGNDIDLSHRQDWIARCRSGEFDHVNPSDLDKYLKRGLARMPWSEMSQSDFLRLVVKAKSPILDKSEMLEMAIKIMQTVVDDPARLYRSEFHCKCLAQDDENGGLQGKVRAPYINGFTTSCTVAVTSSNHQQLEAKKIMGKTKDLVPDITANCIELMSEQ